MKNLCLLLVIILSTFLYANNGQTLWEKRNLDKKMAALNTVYNPEEGEILPGRSDRHLKVVRYPDGNEEVYSNKTPSGTKDKWVHMGSGTLTYSRARINEQAKYFDVQREKISQIQANHKAIQPLTNPKDPNYRIRQSASESKVWIDLFNHPQNLLTEKEMETFSSYCNNLPGCAEQDKDKLLKSAVLANFLGRGKRSNEVSLIFDNIDAAIEKYFGERMSIKDAFEYVRSDFHGAEIRLLTGAKNYKKQQLREEKEARFAMIEAVIMLFVVLILIVFLTKLFHRKWDIIRDSFAKDSHLKVEVALLSVMSIWLLLSMYNRHWDYGVYILMRLAVSCIAVWLMFYRRHLAFPLAFIAIIYQPFLKLSLDKDTWQFVNLATVICSIILIGYLIGIGKKKE